MTSQRAALVALLKVSDLGVVAASFILALAVATPGKDDVFTILEMRIALRNVIFMVGYLGFWHLILRSFGLYRSYRLSPNSREWRDLGAAVLVSMTPMWGLADLLRFDYVTPTFLAAFTSLAFCGLGTERRFFRILARRMRRHGRNLRNVIVVADGDGALDMASHLARRADLGYRILDVIEVDPRERTDGNGAGRSAALDRIGALLESEPVDEVFVALSLATAQPLIRAIVSLCEERGTTCRLLASVVDLIIARAQVDEVDGRPVITIFSGPQDSVRLLAKRMIDIIVSLVSLIVLAPVFLVVAIAIKLDSAGTVFFVQQRVGLNGRRFWFYKFRTMVKDAERQQPGLELLNEAHGPVFKIRNDPRVTRAGRWIRRLSFDELPQLFNVLRGDMSLVGPRPLPLRDVSRIDVRAHKRRFSVRPGITCLWQINGREPEFDDWIKTDMEYIDNWSLLLDAKILLKTIPTVLSGRGAY